MVMGSTRWGTIAVVAALALGAGATVARGQRPGAAPRLLAVGWTGSHGYLGVNFRDISTDEQLSALQLRDAHGVEVIQVDHDGPAFKVGIHEHDVLLQLNGQGIEGAEQLRRMLHELPAGRAISLMFVREGQTQTVTTQLANREALERQAWDKHIPVPVPDQAAGLSAPAATASDLRDDRATPDPGRGPAPGGLGFFGGRAPSAASLGPRVADRNLIGTVLPPSFTGAALETLGPQLAAYFGAGDGNGLLVRSIEPNSPAAVAGLRAGDVVVRVNQVSVASGADWMRLMHESKGRPVQVTILRDKHEQILSLVPDAKHRSSVVLPRPLTPTLAPADEALALAHVALL